MELGTSSFVVDMVHAEVADTYEVADVDEIPTQDVDRTVVVADRTVVVADPNVVGATSFEAVVAVPNIGLQSCH